MINVSKYTQGNDILEFHISPENIDLLAITRCIVNTDEDGIPEYDDNLRRIKFVISGNPIELVMAVEEADTFLTNFNIERSC